LFGFADGLVDGEVENAGHGADGLADGFAGAEEEGVDQVAGVEGGLADKGAETVSAAQAAHARLREAHGDYCRAGSEGSV
jgi:hypothetical protein